MGRNGHGPKWLWAEMVMGRNGYGPKLPGIFLYSWCNVSSLWQVSSIFNRICLHTPLSYLYTRRLRRNYLSMKAIEFPILLRYLSKDLMTKYTKLTR